MQSSRSDEEFHDTYVSIERLEITMYKSLPLGKMKRTDEEELSLPESMYN